jgi:DNA-binding response OmpR family regulator
MDRDKNTVLIVEDDDAILMGLEENLTVSGYEALTASNGTDGLDIALSRKPDLVLLDLMLPDISGYEICHRIRDKGLDTPIIMLTARDEEFDKVHGFEVGADDYVTKPFSINELLARIKAILSRGKRNKQNYGRRRFDSFLLNMNERTLYKEKAGKGRKAAKSAAGQWKAVPLTRTEFDLLAYFLANEGRALSREEVMNEVWGQDYYGTQRSLDSFVAALRSKIEDNPRKPRHILTVHGIGYKFVS